MERNEAGLLTVSTAVRGQDQAAFAVSVPIGHFTLDSNPLLPHLWEHLLLGDPRDGLLSWFDSIGGYINATVDIEFTTVFGMIPTHMAEAASDRLNAGLGLPASEPPFYPAELSLICSELRHMSKSRDVRIGCAIREALWPGRGPTLPQLMSPRSYLAVPYPLVRELFYRFLHREQIAVAFCGRSDSAQRFLQRIALPKMDTREPLRDTPLPVPRRATRTKAVPTPGPPTTVFAYTLPGASSVEVRTLVRVTDMLLFGVHHDALERALRSSMSAPITMSSTVVETQAKSLYVVKFRPEVPCAEHFPTTALNLLEAGLSEVRQDLLVRQAAKFVAARTRRAFAEPLRRAVFLSTRGRDGTTPGALVREALSVDPQQVYDFMDDLAANPPVILSVH